MEHVATGSNGSFGTSSVGAEKLIQTMFKLRTGYRPGAVWAMSKTTLAGVRQLKDAAGSFIWLPNMANNGAAEVNPYSGSLFGHPVVEMEDMDPFTTTDALAVAFGSFLCGLGFLDGGVSRFGQVGDGIGRLVQLVEGDRIDGAFLQVRQFLVDGFTFGRNGLIALCERGVDIHGMTPLVGRFQT